jgi:hypothetical protein
VTAQANLQPDKRTEETVLFLCSVLGEPSVEKLMMVCFLADWAFAVLEKMQLTNSSWYHTQAGATSDSVLAAIASSSFLSLKFNGTKSYLSLSINPKYESLTESQRLVLDSIAKQVGQRDDPSVNVMVSTSYPMIVTEVGDNINLERLAEDFRNARNRTAHGIQEEPK